MTEPTTNQKVASLLLEQTYHERMEMARYLWDAISDWQDGDPDDLALLLEGWADNEIEDEQP